MVFVISKLGCCSGVKNALKLFLKTKKEHPNKKVAFNHELVHNLDTLKQLDPNDDISIVNVNEVSQKMDDTILIFSAHGHTIDEDKRKNLFYETKDALCPLLLNEYKILDDVKNDNTTTYLFYGNGKHPETLSVISRYPFLHFIDKNEDLEQQLELIDYKSRVVLFSQSTILFVPYDKIENFIKKTRKIEFIKKPPCKILSERVNELLKLKDKVEKNNSTFIVIGDEQSSNAKELTKLCQTTFKDSECYLVNNLEACKNIKFSNNNFYVISSTSATEHTCNLIIDYLKTL